MTVDLGDIEQSFQQAGIPSELNRELLEAFSEAKQRFYRGDLRPNMIEGGRFTEAVFRILQWASSGSYTPMGKTLPSVDRMMTMLENSPASDSVRLHIPRTLRLIYDMRNKRDAAHLADDIDPNLQDATLVVHNMEWVLAELVRLFHKVSPDEAHKIITDLVVKEVPVIQVFNGTPRILRELRASDFCLALLYWRGSTGATLDELSSWIRPSMRRNLRRTLSGLDRKNLVHLDGERWFITLLGEDSVVSARLLDPT